MQFFNAVFTQVLVLFVMIAVGFALTKGKLLGKEGAAQITDVLLYMVTPSVIIDSFSTVGFSEERATQLLISAGAAVLVHVVALAVGFAVFGRCERSRRNLFVATTFMSNCGFMGIPLASAVMGAEGVFLVSVYIAVFNVFVWTVGVSLFRTGGFEWRRIVLNPGIIGLAVGLVLFFVKIELPAVIAQPLGYMAGMNSPLAMIVIGYYLASGGLLPRRGDGAIFAAIGARMVVVPLLCLGLLWLLGLRGNLLMGAMIPAAAPAAAMVMMLSAKFTGDGVEGSRIVSFSHLLSITTIPLLLTLCYAVG